ncbi:hypothetical protein Kpho02_16770 [Kitasatospora phosalacinea]|uniref:DUF4082 domain-containing protein n=1 Tax=Kitasatospora phosalacinea TaxID=2065 RepID=A0A9W6V0L6_9ACTN|nr:hypothetical protein [Kitasatospora phosalacinea]GLW69378.1 hypothetical protein Kpho02_16770 [Kitasatospora phosalacinea]
MGAGRTLRRTALAAAALAVLAATSGCTVPVDAVAGIAVTEDGHLLGVVLVCGHRIDAAVLHAGDGSDHEGRAGRWTARSAHGPGLTTWTLDAPAEGWDADGPVAPLVAGTTYTFYGATTDNSWASTAVSFTTADRDGLTPGNVRYDRIGPGGDSSPRTVPIEEFEATACREG